MIDTNSLNDIKERTEMLIIGFNFANKEHKKFINRIQEEAYEMGLWVSVAGEMEEKQIEQD